MRHCHAFPRLTAVLLLLCCTAFLPSTLAADSCAAETFTCPNCGGIEVGDCLTKCDGYLNTDLQHGICFSRKLFNNHDDSETNHDEHYHFLWNDIVGAIVWFFAAGVATACGVGGGGIYVPLGIILLQFAPKPASGLSQASIFGASLGGLILNLKARYPNNKIKNTPCERDDEGNIVLPEPDDDEDLDDDGDVDESMLSRSLHSGRKYYTRPIIDYDMALFLAPMEMAGAVMGTIIQKVMPNWLYLLLASIILSFTSYKTFKKFFAARKKEKADLEKQAEADERRRVRRSNHSVPSQNTASMMKGSFSGTGGANNVTRSTLEDSDEIVDAENNAPPETSKDPEEVSSEEESDEHKAVALREQYLTEDSRQYPRDKLLALLVLWIGLIIITFLKGGKGVDSLVGITCQSPWFGVLIAMQFLWTIGFAVVFAFKLLKRQKLKDAVAYPYQPHDVMWDNKKVRFYSAFTFLAGVVAGLIGIGGGMVLGPLMLVMGIHPRVSTATTATMIVLTSSTVAIMFVTAGLVPWSYAVFFFFVCFSGAFIGKKYIDGYVKKTGKSSILIVILATIIGLATTGCLVIVFTSLARNNWCLSGFKPFCYVSSGEDTCVGNRLMSFVEDVYSNSQEIFVV